MTTSVMKYSQGRPQNFFHGGSRVILIDQGGSKSKNFTDRIEVDVDAADVGGAHCREREEAVLPLAHVHGALVDAEQTL